jgi:hypothetical protein
METASDVLKQMWSNTMSELWVMAVGFLTDHILGLLVFCLIISLIVFIQSFGFYRFSAGINKGVGSLFRILFCILIFIIFYLLFGTDVIDDMMFWIIGFVAYKLAGLFLRGVGFWKY